MNKEIEIIEGNKLIAQFMGIETKVYSDTPTVTRWNFGGFMRQENDMKYHTSWDWIMPVVEKIAEYRLAYDEAHIVCDCRVVIGIGYLWQKVIDFIKFYNQQPESTPQEKQS